MRSSLAPEKWAGFERSNECRCLVIARVVSMSGRCPSRIMLSSLCGRDDVSASIASSLLKGGKDDVDSGFHRTLSSLGERGCKDDHRIGFPRCGG
jgi:hypothetical protein